MNGFFLTNLSFSHLVDHHAYLDPGSGSFILQLILAAILGSFLVLRSHWTKVKDFVLNLFNRNPGEEKDDSELGILTTILIDGFLAISLLHLSERQLRRIG